MLTERVACDQMTLGLFTLIDIRERYRHGWIAFSYQCTGIGKEWVSNLFPSTQIVTVPFKPILVSVSGLSVDLNVSELEN